MSDFSDKIQHSADLVGFSLKDSVDIAVILGSGLSDVAQIILADQDDLVEIRYEDIACLPQPSVPSHAGKLLIGTVAGLQVAVLQGRSHLYEGFSAQQVSASTYLMSKLGATKLIVSNAAGALNSAYKPGDLMLIEDHINMSGHNPIIGQDDHFGSPFADMSQAYQRDLISQCLRIQADSHVGVYASVLGPSLETSAERRMLRALGADAVGMSTTMEVIAAKQCGMQVLGLSAITNLALGGENQQTDTIEEIFENAKIAGKKIGTMIRQLLESN